MLLVKLLLVEGGVRGEEGRRGERRLGHLARRLRRRQLLLHRLHHWEGRDRRGRRVLGARLWVGAMRERLELIPLKLRGPYLYDVRNEGEGVEVLTCFAFIKYW